MKIIVTFIALVLVSKSQSQTTSDCGTTYLCFVSPSGCINSGCTFIYKWKNNGNNLTDFFIGGNIGGSISSNWLAIGFSTDQSMDGDDVVICSVPAYTAQHYVNGKYVAPTLMNSANPSVGLSNPVVNINNGWLTCSFSRMISMASQPNYFDLSKPYYILAAYGPISSGNLQYHTNRVVSSSAFNFQFSSITTAPTTVITSQTTYTTVVSTQSQTLPQLLTTIPTCKDTDINSCQQYLAANYCTQTYPTVLSYCPVSCKTCPTTTSTTSTKISATTPASTIVQTSYTQKTTQISTVLQTSSNNAAVDTSDCGLTKGCFKSPNNCAGNSCQFIFKYTADGNSTYFNLYGNVGTLSNQWLAIGFSLDQKMGSDNVVLCTSSGTIDHRINPVYLAPTLLDSNNPSIGLTNTNVTLSNGWLSCSFTRKTSISSNSNYFDLNNQYYILAALGSFTTSRIVGFTGTLSKHINRDFTASFVNFSSFGNTGGDADYLYILKEKSHACLMIIAWMIFAPIGIVIARYHKSMLPNLKLCDVKFWFVLHRPLMMFVSMISIASFIIILWKVGWKWVDFSEISVFMHSIFGMTAIGLSIIQPLIALCRCDPNDKNRYCFNFFHRLFGFSALICSTVAIFLGIYIIDIDLRYYGWSFVAAWAIWMILFLLSMEMIEMRYANSKATYTIKKDDFDGVVYENQDAAVKAKKTEQIKRSKEQIIKEVLLVLHVIVVLGLSVALIVFIGIN